MKQSTWVMGKKRLMLVGAVGFVGQFGNCDFGEITATTTSTTTIDGRELLISLVRGAIITPFDQWVTNTVNDTFGPDNE